MGHNGATRVRRESKLIGIGGGYLASVLGGKDVVPSIGEDAGQQGIHILVQIETRGCHSPEMRCRRTESSRFSAMSASTSERLS